MAEHAHRGAAMLAVAILTAAGAFAAMPVQRVAAQDQCTQNSEQGGTDNTGWDCNWTQLQNDWPDQGADPDCHGECAYWLHGQCSNSYYTADQINYSYTWSNGTSVDFHGDMARAVKAWSGEPYCSPFLYSCNCGSATVNLQAYDVGNSGYCGLGGVTTAWEAGGQQYDNHVVSAFAAYNTAPAYPWSDGPPSGYTGAYCDAVAASLHEMGHVLTEGHSSIPSDLMCSNNGGCEDVQSIDGDAESMLEAVYGAYHSSNNSGGSGGCNGCQMACAQAPAAPANGTAMDPTTEANQTLWTVCGTAFSLPQADGYYAKLWDLIQGVPSSDLTAVEQSAVNRTMSGPCAAYFEAKQLLAWLGCYVGIDG